MASFAEWTEEQKKKKKKEQSAKGQSFTDYTKQVLGRDDIEDPADIAPVKTAANSEYETARNRITEIDSELERREQIRDDTVSLWFESVLRGGASAVPAFPQYSVSTKDLKAERKELAKKTASYEEENGLENTAGNTGTWLWNSAMSGLASFNKSVTATADLILGKPLQALGWENNPVSSIADYYSEDYTKWKGLADKEAEKLGGGGDRKFVQSVAEGTTAALPQAIMALMTGGVSLSGTTTTGVASSSATLANTMAYRTGDVLSKAGLTVDAMTKNPQYWTSFVQQYGSDYEQAVESGVDENVAMYGSLLSSLVNAGVEIGVTGGSGIQGLPQEVATGGRSAIYSWVQSSLEEGGEEVVQGVVTRGVNKLLGGNEEVFDGEQMVDEGVMGTLVGGILGGGQIGVQSAANAVQQAQANKLTETEQSVVDKVVEDLIAEEEEAGKTLTAKDKKAIEKRVREDLEKGYISTDTIEEVLGGEDYKAYRDAVDNEESLRNEFDTLNKMKQGEMTGEQIDRRAELKEMLAELKNNSQRDQLRTRLDEVMRGKVENSRLAESYNERARRGQAFEVDSSKFDGKTREILEGIAEKGQVNNTNAAHDFWELAARSVAGRGGNLTSTTTAEIYAMETEKRGAEWVEKHLKGKIPNAYIMPDGTIAINVESKQARRFLLGHEITHDIEDAFKKQLAEAKENGVDAVDDFGRFKQMMFDYERSVTSNEAFEKRLAEMAEKYDGINADAESELLADLVGEHLYSDGKFIEHLSTKDRNMFQRMWDKVKYLYKMATAGSQEARDLERIKREFERVYRESAKIKTDAKGDTKYSLTDNTGKELSKGQQDYFKDSKVRDDDGNLLTVYHTTNNDFTVFDKSRQGDATGDSNTYMGFFFADDAEYLQNFPVFQDGKTDAYYLNIKNPIDMTNISRDAFMDIVEVLGGDVDTAADVYEEMTLANGDQPPHLIYLLQETGADVTYADLIEELKPHYGDLMSKGYDGVINHLSEGRGVKEYIVLDSNQAKLTTNVNPTTDADIRYSLSDSDGRALSPEQADYFKDSKVRDDEGNLKIMHHGSTETFTVFDKRKAKSSGTFGKGFYFTDSVSHANQYGKAYDVYLNITNPLQGGTHDISKEQLRNFVEAIAEDEDYGIDNYGEGATVDSVTDEVFGKSDFEMLMDINVSCVGDMSAAIALFNNVNGTNYDGIITPMETVAFRPEQIKSVDNTNPTADPDIRFSLSESVEETKDLIAIHNMQASELSKAMALGGMPMPSIAIIKAQQSHESYGDVSIIFPKDAIDPKKSRANKVYGGDAWTPTYPSIEYKASETAQEAIEAKIDSLVPYDVQRGLGSAHLDYDNLSSDLNRHSGDMYQAYRNNHTMRYAFLVDNGFNEQLPMKEANLDGSGRFDNSLIVDVVNKLGATEVKRLANEFSWDNKTVIAELMDLANENAKAKYAGHSELLQVLRDKPLYTEKNFGFAQADNIIRAAVKYVDNGFEQTVDYKKATEIINDAVDEEAYKAWLDNLFADIVEKEGIRNNADFYTPSGNRRSWEALHWENTLENVLKVMKAQNQTGDGFFGGVSIFGVANKEYGSIGEIKADSERLQTIPEEEYEALKNTFSNRLIEIADSIKDPNERNSFIATDRAVEEIVDAVRTSKTKAGILNNMRKWNKRVTEKTVDDIVALVNDIANMPTGYFEAKPQRAVGFDEVGVFVIPRNADSKLKQELLNRGYSIAEYDPDVEGDRQKVVNQFEEYKFSLSYEGEQHRYANGDGPMSDLRLEQDIAPVQETAEDIAPTKPMSADDMVSALWDAEFKMQGYDPNAEADATEEAAKQAFNRLRDKDAPPEVEAPYYGESEPATAVDPLADRDWQSVGDRSVKAFMFEHPEVKPFFQAEAGAMLSELYQTTKGERHYNDELYYNTNGEKGWYGTKRVTSDEIAYLLDGGISYAQLERGLNAIIEGNGAENNAVSKRIELMISDRLRNGYTDFTTGVEIPPNQEYISWLNEQQHNAEYADSFAAITDADAPISEEIAPMAESQTVEDVMPIADAPIAEAPMPERYEAIRPKQEKQPRMAKATPAEQARAQVLTEEPKVDKKKNGLWSKIKNNVLDKGMVFEDLSLKTGNRELQAKWNSIRYADGKAQKRIGESLKPIREAVEKTGKTKQFYEYLYHMHNVDRMTLAERFPDMENKPVFGDSVTARESRAIIAELVRENPEFKQYAQEVYDYNTYLREQLVEGGVISRETANLWEKMYPHYVPIRRDGDTGLNINVPLDTGRTGVNAPIKRATGGSRDILPLFDTMGQRTIQTYKAIAKNRFGVELKNTLGTIIESDAVGVDETIDSIDTQDGLLQEGKNGQKPTFTVFENGEKVTFEITDEMYDAMKPTNEVLAKTIKPLNAVSNFRRATLTEYNPWFMLKNAVKDAQDVLINSQHAARTYAAFPKAIAEMTKKGHWYQEYMENGGEQNTYFDNQGNTFTEENKALEIAKKVTGLDAISKANNVIERLPRLAEYIASREAGRSIDVAMLDAARVTTNFAAGGDLAKFVNRNGATFLNASIQGAMQQARNIREAKANGLKGWAKLAGVYTLAGLPALLLNGLIWDDDEEYEELSDYVKQNYYIVGKYGDGKFVRIPKGRTVAVIQNAFEQMDNLRTGDDEVDLKSFVDLVVTNLAPNDPIDNNIFSPIVQVANNQTWYGDDLVPTRLQDVPAAEQYDETTDAISKWLGEQTEGWHIGDISLEISPIKANYLLDQYSGVIGDTFLPMMTPAAESGDNSVTGNLIAPLKDMFTTDSVLKNQNVSDFYDTVDELAVNANGSNATDEDVLKYKYINSVNGDLGELYKLKREVQNSNVDNADKYATVREIQRQIDEIAENALNSYNNVSVMDKYALVGDRHYRWYEPSEDSDAEAGWQKISDKQLAKQNNVTRTLGISASEYWGNKEEYDYAYDNPEKYAVAKAVGGYSAYRGYSKDLNDLTADKDAEGKSISGSRKEKVADYINGLDIDYGEKIILFKSEYNADDTYNNAIIDYLNDRDDISYDEMVAILKELGFTVSSDGTVTW